MQTPPAVPTPSHAPGFDPVLTRVLRKAIERTCVQLPDFDASPRRSLLSRYREAEGPRAMTAHSQAKAVLRGHVEAFRSQYPRVLAACLQRQLDRIHASASRSTAAGTSDDAGDVDPAHEARRIAIDRLWRRITVDGESGLAEFDRRLARQLDLAPAGWRACGLRPAVFFEAIGRCWVRVTDTDRDELEVILGFGGLLLPSVAALYPEVIAMLPGHASSVQRPDDAPLALAAPGRADAAAPAELAAIADLRSRPEPVGDRPSVAAFTRIALELTEMLFHHPLRDSALPSEARALIARLQLPAFRIGIDDASLFTDPGHALRRLLDDVCDPKDWTGPNRDARLTALSRAVDAAAKAGSPSAFASIHAAFRAAVVPAAVVPAALAPASVAPASADTPGDAPARSPASAPTRGAEARAVTADLVG